MLPKNNHPCDCREQKTGIPGDRAYTDKTVCTGPSATSTCCARRDYMRRAQRRSPTPSRHAG